MKPDIPEFVNLADYCLDARIREGRGDRRALITDEAVHTYNHIHRRAKYTGGVARFC